MPLASKSFNKSRKRSLFEVVFSSVVEISGHSSRPSVFLCFSDRSLLAISYYMKTMFHLLSLLLLLPLINNAGHSILALQHLGTSRPSASADFNTSLLLSSKLPSPRSRATLTTDTSDRQSLSLNNVATPLPSPLDTTFGGRQNWQDLNSGICLAHDEYCSYDGFKNISGDASVAPFANQCSLWDAACAGNRTLATEEFFHTTSGNLLGNLCFIGFDCGCEDGSEVVDANFGTSAENITHESMSDCKKYNPPERLSLWKKMKSWMRSSGCVSAKDEWMNMGVSNHTNTGNPSSVSDSCCGGCIVGAQNVDLYYWPEPGTNTSCLSIIGNSVHPFNFGATTAGISPSLSTYWECTAKTPVVSITTGIDNSAITTTNTMIMTATSASVGPISFKQSLINPWASSPCIEADSRPSNGSNDSAEIHDKQASIQARSHTLSIPPSFTQGNSLSISTLVLGNFTL